jgi:heme iron utilization protein
MAKDDPEPGIHVRRLLRTADRGRWRRSSPTAPPTPPWCCWRSTSMQPPPAAFRPRRAQQEHCRRAPGVAARGWEARLGRPSDRSRASLIGRAPIRRDERLVARYLARHPSAAGYAGFGDFKLYALDIERAHLVAGFGKIRWGEGANVVLGGDCGALAAAEPEILAHMNANHADARMLSRGPHWRMTGIDPEGADFRREDKIARLDFSSPVRDVARPGAS